MKVRNRMLSSGWYPGKASAVTAAIREILSRYSLKNYKSVAGIAPHAGWSYSGSIACRVIAGMRKDTETIVVVGGHLPADNMVLAAPEDGFQTPLGTIETDKELLEIINIDIQTSADINPDNTVEIQLPFIKYFFPDAKVVWMRAASSRIANELGVVIKKASDTLCRKVAVLGSTDLTHYGSNYGFSPKGRGEKALEWVIEVNDRRFIDAALALDAMKMLEFANNENSACSGGGAACAASFAREMGVAYGTLVDYGTSYDIYPAESFVGYGGIVYSKS